MNETAEKNAQTHWSGTPIPKVDNPITPTAKLEEIAERVWWNGPPWTVLRNRRTFLYHVIDYGTDDDVAYVESIIPAKDWISALKEAREGEVSRGMCQYFRLRYGVDKPGSHLEWADASHRLDWRPFADDESGDRFRERVLRAKRLERMDRSGRAGAESKP